MIAFQQAFNVFVFEHCVPLFFMLPLAPDFRPADAQCSMVRTILHSDGHNTTRHDQQHID